MNETEVKTKESMRYFVEIDFAEKAYERFKNILKRSKLKTNVSLIINALRLFEWYLDQKEQGNKIQIVRDNKTIEVEFDF